MSQQINLYETRLRPRHELATARNLGLAVLIALVSMMALALWVGAGARQKVQAVAALQGQLTGQQEKLAALAKTVAERRTSPELAAVLEVAKATRDVRAEAMAVLESGKLGSTTGFSGIMAGFARQAQTDLWLTGFRVAGGGDDIEIRGRLLDPARLPAYVQGLGNEAVFQGRRFAALDMRENDSEERKPSEQPAAMETAGKPAPAKPARFVEFMLRSESAAGMAGKNAMEKGGKPR